ncbi:MAG: hypothetical protein JO367_19030 [Actinobacteria bacterium]|nr:hypothetical protein [Actinomycetota bacterium]
MKRLVLFAWGAALYLVIEWLRHLHTGADPAFTAARAFALALAAYLAVATLITGVLALFRVRVRLPLMPLLIVASLSAPMATPVFAATTTTTTSVPAPPVMHRLHTGTTTSTAPPTTAPPTTTPPITTSTTAPPAPPNLSKTAGGRGHSVQTAPAPNLGEVSGTWRVRHGDCMWSISRKVLTARLGRAPSNAEIARYWRPLIEANRSRLVTGDPGLLFAGQELVLP